jgi:hypothetical protein
LGNFSAGAPKGAGEAPALPVYRLNFVVKGESFFSTLMLLVTSTDITVWIVSVLLALGIGFSKYAKWKARNQLVRELAAMDRERREKVLSRMNPAQAMEARQELMRRFNIF